jgi:hypothetical protein
MEADKRDYDKTTCRSSMGEHSTFNGGGAGSVPAGKT